MFVTVSESWSAESFALFLQNTGELYEGFVRLAKSGAEADRYFEYLTKPYPRNVINRKTGAGITIAVTLTDQHKACAILAEYYRDHIKEL